MENTNKKSLSEFNIEEARGWVIDSFNQIDWRLNKIIVDYFKPSQKDKFESIVLNTSIIDIGGKLKILRSIGLLKLHLIENIRNLSSIRNGFAHAPISALVNLELSINNSLKVTSIERMIDIMILPENRT